MTLLKTNYYNLIDKLAVRRNRLNKETLQVANLDSQLLESPQGTTVPRQRAMTCRLFAFLEKSQLENPFNYHGR